MSVLKKWYTELVKGVFNVGFMSYNPAVDPSHFSFSDVHWLKMGNYKHGWFADPFILSINDEIITLLVEEYEYHNHKGRLCKIKVAVKDYQLIDVTPILSLETHLSYPSIYRVNGETYVCPENGESGCLKVYKLKDDKLVEPKIIIEEALADTQLLELDGKYYAFGIPFKDQSKDKTRTLRVFESDSLFGEYHYLYSIENTRREERGAGNIFFDGKRIIRPAQVCEGGYGRAVIFYELQKVHAKFTEKEIGRICPSFWKKWGLGIHQIHSYESLTVIDGRDFYYGIIALIKRIRSKINNSGI